MPAGPDASSPVRPVQERRSQKYSQKYQPLRQGQDDGVGRDPPDLHLDVAGETADRFGSRRATAVEMGEEVPGDFGVEPASETSLKQAFGQVKLRHGRTLERRTRAPF